MLGPAVGLFISLDVHVIEPDLASFDTGKGVANIQLAEADGFNLAASEFDASFISFKDMIVPESFAIGGDFVRHAAAELLPPFER
jgi:hypothetical protein